MIDLTITLFAAARELAQAGRVTVQVPAETTVAALQMALAEQHPVLVSLVSRSRLAVNQQFVSGTEQLPAGAELALIPPVSGG